MLHPKRMTVMRARAICYEIEKGSDAHWEKMCHKIPCCLGTDCKSLNDTVIEPSNITKEKRVALDLFDVREGIERRGPYQLHVSRQFD